MNFSIVIPLYNKAQTVELAIKSILSQTYQNFEIVVVDDGSTDNSVDVVNSIKDSRISLYKKENGGVSSARNYGISKSKCEHIAFLDADDLWADDFLETIYYLISKYPDAGLYATAFSFVYKSGEKFCPEFKYVDNCVDGGIISDFCKSACDGINPISASSLCINKKVFDIVGVFPVGVKRGEDLDMWLRVACEYDVAFYNVSKAYYCLDAGDNANKKINNIDESFPYHRWKYYNYKNKKSLRRYSNKMLFHLGKKSLKAGLIYDAFVCFARMIYS